MYNLFLLNLYLYIYISMMYCLYLLLNNAYLVFFDVLTKIIVMLLISFFLGQIYLFTYLNIIIFLKIISNWLSSTSSFFNSSINSFYLIISTQYLFFIENYIENIINKKEFNITNYYTID